MDYFLNLKLSEAEFKRLDSLANRRNTTPEQCIKNFISVIALEKEAWEHPTKVRPAGSRDEQLLRSDLLSFLGKKGADLLEAKNHLVKLGHFYESAESTIRTLVEIGDLKLDGWHLSDVTETKETTDENRV